ncbi:hypothetical protein VTI74DRAFT_4974 [Chaetomium olivicolor]
MFMVRDQKGGVGVYQVVEVGPRFELSSGGEVTLAGVVDAEMEALARRARVQMGMVRKENQANPVAAIEGSQCAIQTLYEGEERCKCCKNWLAECPDDLRVAVENQHETKQKALVVRMCKRHGDDSSKPLVLHSIVFQSPSLKKTLAQVFEGYKGITASLKKLVFRAPFYPFYHVWERFTQILECQKQEDPETANIHAAVALFQPGVVFVAPSRGGEERFYVVVVCQYHGNGSGFSRVTARIVDWNGSGFGYRNEQIDINQFEGTRRITDLPVFPVKFDPSSEEAKTKAIARGRKFRYLAGIRSAFGRIMIDAVGHPQYRLGFYTPNMGNIHLTPLDAENPQPALTVTDDVHQPEAPPFPPPPPQVLPASPSHSQPMILTRHVHDDEDFFEQPATSDPSPDTTTLTETQLLLCSPDVRGYSLKLKLWCLFSVSGISPIAFNDAAFPNLMIPPSYKDLVLSFVEAHPTSNTASKCPTSESNDNNRSVMFDDLIEGKGLSIILLLVGNPGTGKTLTAEAVADKVRRPLYVLSAGELGQHAEDLARRLREALELAEQWDAVLLFDECDVYLQERLLEYYRGIMFMTSNRAETIDRAFHSRIHLTLRYPDLDAPAKEHIWRHFTKLVGADDSFTAEVYEKLAGLPINGRQIKNTVRTATLVAARETVPLGVEHVQIAVETTQGQTLLGLLGLLPGT